MSSFYNYQATSNSYGSITGAGEDEFLLGHGTKQGHALETDADHHEEKKSWLRRKVSLLALIPVMLLLAVMAWRSISSTDYSVSISSHFSSSESHQGSGGRGGVTGDDDEYCTACTLNITYCTEKSAPVLGGVDVVATYNSFDSSTKYQQVATAGSSAYTAIYAGYTFYFASASNKEVFEADPTTYLPKWGGFCSWATAAETCPDYPWSADCMGPNGNWYTWGVFKGGLHFFLMTEPLDYFYEDVDKYVADGDKRWKEWFGDEVVLSTNCWQSSDI